MKKKRKKKPHTATPLSIFPFSLSTLHFWEQEALHRFQPAQAEACVCVHPQGTRADDRVPPRPHPHPLPLGARKSHGKRPKGNPTSCQHPAPAGLLQQAAELAPPLGRSPASAALQNKRTSRREQPPHPASRFHFSGKGSSGSAQPEPCPEPSPGSPAEAASSPGARQALPGHPATGQAMAPATVPRPLPGPGLSQQPLKWHRGTLGQPAFPANSPRPANSPAQEKGTSRGGEGKGDIARGEGDTRGTTAWARLRPPKASREQGRGGGGVTPAPPAPGQLCVLGKEAKPGRWRGDKRAARRQACTTELKEAMERRQEEVQTHTPGMPDPPPWDPAPGLGAPKPGGTGCPPAQSNRAQHGQGLQPRGRGAAELLVTQPRPHPGWVVLRGCTPLLSLVGTAGGVEGAAFLPPQRAGSAGWAGTRTSPSPLCLRPSVRNRGGPGQAVLPGQLQPSCPAPAPRPGAVGTPGSATPCQRQPGEADPQTPLRPPPAPREPDRAAHHMAVKAALAQLQRSFSRGRTRKQARAAAQVEAPARRADPRPQASPRLLVPP